MKDKKFFSIPAALRYTKSSHRPLIRLMVFGFLACAMDVILPLFQDYAISSYTPGADLKSLKIFILLYLIVLAVSVLADIASAYAACEVEMYSSRDLRRAGFAHLQTLSASYYNTHGVGYIYARLMNDTGKISVVLSWVLYDIFWGGVYLLGALVSMFLLNARLAFWVLLVEPPAILLAAYFKRRLTEYNHKVREANAIVTERLNEGISGVKTSKSLVIEQRMLDSFQHSTDALARVSIRMGRSKALFAATFSLMSSCVLALVLWHGGIIAQEGVLLVGTLSVFLSYALEMANRLSDFVNAIANLISIEVNIDRFVTLMNHHTEVNDSPAVIEKYGDLFHPKEENWEPLHGDIEFEDVTFRYPDGGENVLEHFSLKIPQGTNCAIVGRTGAGKSTLVNLVCRFFEPTEGRILIDGRDARERSLAWLHANTGYVLQTPHLFSGSIRENLLYGNPSATQEQLEDAVRRVSAQDIIERMGGYDADVGEGGSLLSTGEKQLLSFARALIADPRIFILDEATSAIDTVTERKIQNAIEISLAGRTSFVIAHRLSTIRQADIILVVDNGKIVERGTHDELMAQKGHYYDLYLQQFYSEAIQKSAE